MTTFGNIPLYAHFYFKDDLETLYKKIGLYRYRHASDSTQGVCCDRSTRVVKAIAHSPKPEYRPEGEV